MEEALIALLLASSVVRAQVGSQVFPGRRPQDEPLPALVLTRVSGAPGLTHDGPEGCEEARVQIDAYAPSYGAAKAAARAVRDALHGFKGDQGGVELQGVFLEAERDEFEREEPDPIHRVSLDFTVWAVAP